MPSARGGHQGIERKDRPHETVNHGRKEYTRGEVHTNGIEDVWSLLERSIFGSFHHVSVEHLPAYLDELEWRFNNRKNPFLFRDTLLALIDSEVMTYEKLVS